MYLRGQPPRLQFPQCSAPCPSGTWMSGVLPKLRWGPLHGVRSPDLQRCKGLNGQVWLWPHLGSLWILVPTQPLWPLGDHEPGNPQAETAPMVQRPHRDLHDPVSEPRQRTSPLAREPGLHHPGTPSTYLPGRPLWGILYPKTIQGWDSRVIALSRGRDSGEKVRS